MKRYKVIEFVFYFILTIVIIGILSFLPTNFTYYLSIFVFGFALRVFLSKKHPKKHIKNLNRFSLAKIFYNLDKAIWKVQSQPVRFIVRVLLPYFIMVSITLLLKSDSPAYLALIGSISFDISLVTLGKFKLQNQ